jgi:hypothetical protein
MAITYTYKIKSLQAGTERINKQEFPHAIRAVIWDLIGTDENGKTETLSNITTFLNFKTKSQKQKIKVLLKTVILVSE